MLSGAKASPSGLWETFGPVPQSGSADLGFPCKERAMTRALVIPDLCQESSALTPSACQNLCEKNLQCCPDFAGGFSGFCAFLRRRAPFAIKETKHGVSQLAHVGPDPFFFQHRKNPSNSGMRRFLLQLHEGRPDLQPSPGQRQADLLHRGLVWAEGLPGPSRGRFEAKGEPQGTLILGILYFGHAHGTPKS